MIDMFHRALNGWYAVTTPSDQPLTTTIEREQARKARLLSLMTLWCFILSSPLFFRDVWKGFDANFLNVALFEVLMLLTIFLNRRGYLAVGGYVFIFGYISQITWGMLAVQRNDGAGILFGWAHYAIAPILAGLFLPFWSPILFGLLDYAIIAGIFVIDSRQGYFTVILRPTGANSFLIHAAIAMFASSVAGMFYSYSQARAIAQADRATELEQAHAELSVAHAKLEHLATIDPITGLLNHRALNAQLAQEMARAHRTSEPLSLIFGDIDHFKQVNDRWGHQTGDEVLAHVAKLLRAHSRACDSVARYGGEEFVVILPGQPHDDALQSAERLRAVIAAAPMVANTCHISITMSLGVATCSDHAQTCDTLIACADSAMYGAKHGGRNRVCSPNDTRQRSA